MHILSAVPRQLVAPIVALMKKANNSYRNTGEYYKASRDEVPPELMALFKQHTKGGVVNDPLYDALEAELRRLDPGNPVLKDTGVAPKRNKIKAPFAMPSLSKIKGRQAVERWLGDNPGPYVVSDKIDGNSIGAKYASGTRTAFTKGRAGIAGDISFMADSLGLPESKRSLEIRGEVVMPVATFNRLWTEHYENPRNMMSGLLNKNDLHEGLSHAKVYWYELITPRVKPSEAFAQMKALGLRTVPHKRYDVLDYDTLIEILEARRSKATYEMDGLVIVQDRKNPVNTSDNPTFACAFKDDEADEVAVTTVVNVEWNLTRTGYLFPRIVIEPVRLKGVTVNYASGKSAARIRDWKIGPGARIKIARSGDVIPDVREVIKAVRPQLPDASHGEWEWSGENIRITDHENMGGTNESITLQGIQFFFTTIGVERFKYATIAKFAAAGVGTLPAILKLTRRQFVTVSGASEKVLGPVYDAIQTAITDVELHTLMYASGVFGRSYGSRRFTAILKAIPDVLDWTENRSALVEAVDDVPGFDLKTAQQFAAKLPAFRKWLKTVPQITYVAPRRAKVRSKLLANQRIVMTGFRDAELTQRIVENGGEVIDSIKKATILLAKDVNGSGSKLDTARALKIPVLTADQFIRKYFKVAK